MTTTIDEGMTVHTIVTNDVAALDAGRVLQDVEREGAVLIRTGRADVAAFEAFTQSVASSFQVHGNPARAMVSKDGYTQVVDAGTHALPSHSELSYLPFYPDTIWFYCEVAPPTEGATTICDGITLLEELTPATRRFFADNRIRYTHKYAKNAWSRSIPVATSAQASRILDQMSSSVGERGTFRYHFDDDEAMHVSYATSAISLTRARVPTFANSLEVSFVPRVVELRGGGVTMEDGSPVPRDHLEDVAAASARTQRPVTWADGDILMIDNSRVMHGRTAIADAAHRRIYVRVGNRNA